MKCEGIKADDRDIGVIFKPIVESTILNDLPLLSLFDEVGVGGGREVGLIGSAPSTAGLEALTGVTAALRVDQV